LLVPLAARLLTLALGTGTGSPLALYPLQSRGVDAATTRSIDASLRAQIASMDRFQLFSLGETRSVLRPPGGALGLSCDGGEDECLAGVGRLLGGAVVAFGRLSPEGAELWLVVAKTSGEVRRVQASGPPLEAAREAAVALLTPDRYVGLLSVEGSVGRVAVDGVSRGDLPLPAPLVLAVGRHTVALSIPGQGTLDATADVRFGQTFVVTTVPPGAAATAPIARPGVEPGVGRGVSLRTASYFVLAAGVLSLGAGIACGAVSADNAQALQNMARPIPLSQFSVVNGEAQRTQGFAIAADVLFGTAAILGVTGVVLYLVGGNHGSSGGSAGIGVKMEANGVSIAF
jgi:hypothetical protein